VSDYLPKSPFLASFVDADVPLDGLEGEANLDRLIALMGDADVSNRDWAATLLALSDRDDARIRAALRMGAEDVDPVVRGEALCGLARRDPAVALPLVRRELDRDESNIAVMNAAEELADPTLAASLLAWAEGHDPVAEAARDAIRACGAAAT
jgi:hypothetical protein